MRRLKYGSQAARHRWLTRLSSGGPNVPLVGRAEAPCIQGASMNNLLRGGLAGLAAWKWGGGCLGTIIVFLIVYWLLGHF